MKIKLSTRLATVAAVLLALSAPALRAQDDADDDGSGLFYLEVAAWVTQASGVAFHPATVIDESDANNSQLLTMPSGSETRGRYRGGYEMAGNVGGFIFTWFAHEEFTELGASNPGNYIYGELLAHPVAAGFENDGLADGFIANGRTNMRDFRLDFYRTAFNSARVNGKWYVGYRRVQAKREQDAEYQALLNSLPPLIPPVSDPRPDLDPLSDVATMDSDYRGRGIEAGMDLLMPLWKNKITLEAGFGLALLRGKVDTSYRSTNAYYVDGNGDPLSPPYGPVWSDPAAIDDVEQTTFVDGLTAQSEPMNSHVLDANLGFRWNAWRGLDVFAGWRTTQYVGVGLDLRTKQLTDISAFNVVDLDETERSVTYEGIYFGVSFGF